MSLNIRDPIHGFIQINDIETQLIQTYSFQRLRFIHQLGTTSWIYPTGVHTRFDHSLGVLHLAARFVNRLKLLNLEISDEDEKVFRIAALLHDIGHAPFSHLSEDMKLFREGWNHEKMGEKIIIESEIGKIIRSKLGDESVDRIIFIITGRKKPVLSLDNLFHILLTGQAGIDRMDYLLRDSYFLGVMYGKFDLERILETFMYDEEHDIFWEDGGKHALEQFLLARYFMFTEVYFHKTRRILDYHLSILVKEYLKSEKKEEFLPLDVEEYLKINDLSVLHWMMNTNNSYKNVFLNRKFFKKINIESDDHPDEAEIIKWQWLETELSRQFSATDYYLDKADKAPYKFENPEDVKIAFGNKILPLSKISKLVASLRPIRKRRIYASEERKEDVFTFVKTFFDKFNKKGGYHEYS